MIPFCNGNAILTAILSDTVKADSLNDDLNWHVANAPVAERTPWPLRLLPRFVRTQLWARLSARAYEDKLIAIWETSPHLLDDIGIALSNDGRVPENMVAAPARVLNHVHAVAEEKAAAAALPPVKDAPVTPAQVFVPVRKEKARAAQPAAVPAWA